MQLGRLLLSLPLSGYWPGPPHGLQEALGLIKLGGYLTATGVAIYFARNLDNVLIGWSCGAEELAYYSRAYFLMLLPSMVATSALTGVMVPCLSALRLEPGRKAGRTERP